MATPPLQERKLVTVLFADITGSTGLGERFDPERWHALLQRFFSAMSSSIEAWGGTVEKFIGDAVMAVFGVPIMREDDAERALRAGFEMLERLAVVNHDFQARHGVSLSIRIGINSGDVVTASGPHLIVSGDPVNVAARLEQVAEPGTILVGERTYAATRDGFVFGPAISRELKGKSAPVTVRQALRPLADSLERRVGMQVAMVGREREIESLVDLLHEAIETGSPRMAMIHGPAGIGKSRLVREFLNLASAQHAGTTILQGRCPSAGQGITYWGFGDLLRRACGIGLDDPAEMARERLRIEVERVLGNAGVSQPEIDHTIFALAITAGIQVPGNPLEELRPLAVANEIAIAWPRFLSAYAAAGPAILAIEDLHWAGDELVAVLERLLARSTGGVLLIAASRPEFSETHPGFAAGRDDVGVISLRPLTTAKGTALFNEILAGSQVPEPFRDELVAKAAGNPLFLEEILRRLIETGALFRADEHWQADATALRQQLPDTVQAVLAARIDALGSPQKRALQEAAVIGQTFWEEPVGQAAGDAEISTTLAGLESKALISARPTSSIANQTEFAFRHALVRDVAYASLSRVRRARAHAEAGRWIAKLAGERREELAELIAHHYRTALLGEDSDLAWADEDAAVREQLRRDALAALLVAGAAARKRYAIPKALDLHQEALRVSRDGRERAQVLEQLGDDHEGAFQGDDAVAAWEGALAALGDDEDEARVRISLKCAKMTGIRWGGFKVVPPISKVEGYIDAGLAARPGRAERGWLLALRAYCGARWTGGPGGDPSADRVRAGEDARSIARELLDVDMEVLATRALSGLATLRGDYQEAMTLTRQELAIVDRITASRDRALSLFFMGLRFADIEGDYELGLALAERSHVLGKQLTPHEVMHADYLRLYGNMALGRWSEIDAILEEHVIAFQQDSDMACPYARGGPLIGATILAHRGDLERAREAAALVVSTDPAAPWLPLPLALQGMFLLAAGAPVEAMQLAEQVLASGRRPTIEESPLELIVMLDALIALRDADGLRTFVPTARATLGAMALLPPALDRAEGVLHLWEGDRVRARQRLEQALHAYRRLGNVFESSRTQELLSQVLPPEAASSARSDALSGYQGLGAEPFAARLRGATAPTVN